MSSLLSNATFLNEADQLSPALVVLRTAYITVTSLTIICLNSMTIAVMLRIRGEFPPGSTKVAMTSLAISDLGVGIMSVFCIPLSALDRWPFEVMWPCTVMCSVIVLLSGISVFNLLTLSIDRLVAITKPLLYPTLLPQKRTLFFTIFGWVNSTVLVVLVMAAVQPIVEYNRDAVMCEMKYSKASFYIDVIFLCVIFIFAVVVMLGIYLKLIHISHVQAKKINMLSNAGPRRERGNPGAVGSGKAVKLLLVIVVMYTIGWLPFCSVRIYGDRNPDGVPGWLEFVSVWLAINNSWCNFVVYIGMNKTFRSMCLETLRELIKHCRRN
ncbi:histamine H2 receptor-like [Asterias amurensis]|uniref:histamine H2 receptor-like n=1 Tax=Asterias amurensis TaxID=7602 RepID=UPI003AB14B06